MPSLRFTAALLALTLAPACTMHVQMSSLSGSDGGVDFDDDAAAGSDPGAATASGTVPAGDPDEGYGGGGAAPGAAGGGTIDDPCRGTPPRGAIVGTAGDDVLNGTPNRDVIWGLSGDDVINGGGGDDIICAGGGEDRIDGGAGDDYIDAGFGRDTVFGGHGDDTLHGRNGGDILHGGPGNDAIFGDLLDDHLYGDEGADLLVGGHGTDVLHGGEGADWLRGDTGHDTFIGGAGVDTVSFMTATPPGQPRNEGAPLSGDGVIVDLTVQPVWERETWDGLASGDGFREMLRGVERVLGSPFSDTLIGAAGTRTLNGAEGDDVLYGARERIGGGGVDTCDDSGCDGSESVTRAAGAYAYVDARPRDPGLVVLGATGAVDDSLRVQMIAGMRVRVTSLGGAITPGPGCTVSSDFAVECTVPRTLRYVLVYTGDGNDTVHIGSGFPRDMAAHVDGGTGDDTLTGGDGEDVLFTGRSGRDVLSGNGGDDALLSESFSSHKTMTGAEYPDGGDRLDGGPGNDQLVSDYPCGAHHFSGGPGVDIAGFARSADLPIHAHLGRGESGRAHVPSRCETGPHGTELLNDLEILEGADGNDVLTGNDGPNTIWGWGGNDVISGGGGDDTLEGHLGDDVIRGGAGRDILRGGGGFDHLHAADENGAADREINCSGGNLVSRDPSDPAPIGC